MQASNRFPSILACIHVFDRGVRELGKHVAGPHLDKLVSLWSTIRARFNYIAKSTGILSGNVILSNDQSERHHYPTHLVFVELC